MTMRRQARLPVMVGMFPSNINALSGEGRGIAYGLPGASPIGPRGAGSGPTLWKR